MTGLENGIIAWLEERDCSLSDLLTWARERNIPDEDLKAALLDLIDTYQIRFESSRYALTV